MSGISQPATSSAVEPDNQPEDPCRMAKIAELRQQYNAGKLVVEEASLAAKLVDAHLVSRPLSQK